MDIAIERTDVSEGAPARSRERLLYLDGWRGISIALVLMGHFTPVRGINLGLLGVEFFFVLSGRLMAEILFIERYPLKKFFKRRFSRIYPALLVYVLISMVALSGTLIAFKWKAALTALTFTYNYAGAFVTRAGALDHVWSLSVEEHSYVFLAIMSLVFVRNSRGLMLAVLASAALALMNGAASWAVMSDPMTRVYWRTDVHIASILLSVLLCLIKAGGYYPRILQHPLISVFAAMGATAAFLDAAPMPLHYVLGTALLAIAVNSIDYSAKAILSALSTAPMVTLGLWSYSLYLWQQPFFQFRYHIDGSPVLCLAGAFACAIASYYLVEKPSRSWLNRNW
ncbi:acyltransferase [Devosia sp. 919]|uniref:acyltransferase family protein n=1 Tax=Devosia sp. 919 TaxID=2726065 RepID=UPI001555C855|nr:acyltransferase [Devosia sp. 919]